MKITLSRKAQKLDTEIEIEGEIERERQSEEVHCATFHLAKSVLVLAVNDALELTKIASFLGHGHGHGQGHGMQSRMLVMLLQG